MANGVHTDGENVPEPSTSAAQGSVAAAKLNDYLVGAQLDEALATGQDVDVFWPFEDGDVKDWTQAEAIWFVRVYVMHINVLIQ